MAIHLSDDVALLNASLGSSAILHNLSHIDTLHSAIVSILAILLLKVNLRLHVASADTNHSTLHGAILLQVGHHLVHHRRRNSEAIAAI